MDGSWVIFLNAFNDETSTKQLNCTITVDCTRHCSESTTERKGNAEGGEVAKWSKALLLISLLKKINENHKKIQGSPRHLKKGNTAKFCCLMDWITRLGKMTPRMMDFFREA